MHKTPLVESMHSEWIAFSPSSPIHFFLLILILIVGRFLQTERGREGERGARQSLFRSAARYLDPRSGKSVCTSDRMKERRDVSVRSPFR